MRVGGVQRIQLTSAKQADQIKRDLQSACSSEISHTPQHRIEKSQSWRRRRQCCCSWVRGGKGFDLVSVGAGSSDTRPTRQLTEASDTTRAEGKQRARTVSIVVSAEKENTEATHQHTHTATHSLDFTSIKAAS